MVTQYVAYHTRKLKKTLVFFGTFESGQVIITVIFSDIEPAKKQSNFVLSDVVLGAVVSVFMYNGNSFRKPVIHEVFFLEYKTA